MATILIVDDSKFMRLTLKNLIERSFKGAHQVIGEAEDTPEALEKYKQLRPDLVTMDIILPTESGLECVKRIVAFDANAKVIMVSAMGQDKIMEEALAFGAKAFVVKPIKPEELVKAISSIL
jgi:two-component system chemotaxis response regulator CheY